MSIVKRYWVKFCSQLHQYKSKVSHSQIHGFSLYPFVPWRATVTRQLGILFWWEIFESQTADVTHSTLPVPESLIGVPWGREGLWLENTVFWWFWAGRTAPQGSFQLVEVGADLRNWIIVFSGVIPGLCRSWQSISLILALWNAKAVSRVHHIN